jgi:hypothetical protein
LFAVFNNLREGHDGYDDGHDGDAGRDGSGDGLKEGRFLKLLAFLKYVRIAFAMIFVL